MPDDQPTNQSVIEYKRVYHFLPAEWALDDIKNRRLKISEFEDMNDPFELWCVKQPKRLVRDAMRGFKKEFGEKYGLICFCEVWENPLLWSHYADKHRGICLGFDVDRRGLCPVNYMEERSELPDAPTEEFASQLYSTKYAGWKYEQEWRVTIQFDEEEDRPRFYYWGPQSFIVLREVIVGLDCGTTREDVEAALGEHSDHIEIIKARLAFNTFRVVKKQDGFKAC